MMRRSLTKLGLVLVVAGALLLAGPVFGFSTLGADRGVNVGTAEDPNAILGITDNSGDRSADIHPRNNREGEVFFLTDNTDAFSDGSLEAEVVSFDGSDSNLAASVESTDGQDGSTVIVRCGSSSANSQGPLTVSLSATGSVDIELDRTTSQPIEVNCRGGGGFNSASVSNVNSFIGEPVTQTITFEPDSAIGPQDTVEIDLSEPQNGVMNYEDAQITAVSGGKGDAEFIDSDTLEFDTQGTLRDEVTIELDGVLIESQFSGNQYTVTFERTDTGGTATAEFSSTRFLVVE